MTSTIKKYVGDKAFYRRALTIAVPIMIQNGITNFVNLLDNIMVGRIGTEQMSGVAITNQLIMIFFLCIFGSMSGAGIFTAQYFGENNHEGIRQTMRFKIWAGAVITAIAVTVFILYGNSLISLYLRGGADGGDIAAALHYGRQYMLIMLIALPPYMISQVYTSTLRECNETIVPMKASFLAVIVNLGLNYVLIFGKLGFPQLGIAGAAIATVAARYSEMLYIIIWSHKHNTEHEYIKGLYKTMRVPFDLFRKFLTKSTSLLVNEGMWSCGMAMLSQCYSVRGLSVVAGLNIANTIFNVFSIVFVALGDAIAIIVGQLLGAGKMDEARATDTKLITFSVVSCAGVAIVMAFIAPFFPSLYNTTESSREIATQFIFLQALFLPQAAFMHATYFTLRSGGRIFITFLTDSLYMWVVPIPLAFILSRFTGISAVWIFAFVQIADWVKCVLGYIMVKKGIWLHNIVSN